jgi:hypothetical protein
MFSLVLLSLFVNSPHEWICQEIDKTFLLARGRYLGSQVKPGMTSKKVLAILGVPKYGGVIPSGSSCEVGSKGCWIYVNYGVRVNWYTATEIWWSVPSGCLNDPNAGPYTPETARVTDVEFQDSTLVFWHPCLIPNGH